MTATPAPTELHDENVVFSNKNREEIAFFLQSALDEGLKQVAAEAEYPDPKFSVNSLPDLLTNLLSSTLMSVIRANNAKLPLFRLPIELLGEVFTLIPLRQKPHLSNVCRTWHQALYFSSSVWDNIVFMASDFRASTPSVLQKILSFSRQSTLHLDITFREETFLEDCAALMNHISRCVTLRIDFAWSTAMLEPIARQRFTELLSQPVPHLVKLWLFDGHALYDSRLSPTRCIFSGDAPQLRTIKLHCDIHSFMPSESAFNAATHVMFYPVRQMSRSTTNVVFSMFPNAAHFSFVLYSWMPVADDTLNDELPLQLGSQVESVVTIALSHDADARRFLRGIHWEKLRTVRIEHDPDALSAASGGVVNLFAPASQSSQSSNADTSFVPTGMSLEAALHEEESILILLFARDDDPFAPVERDGRVMPPYTDPGVERIVFGMHHSTQLDPSLFTHIRRLTLTETAFDADVFGCSSTFPEMAELVHLTVYLLNSVQHTKPWTTGALNGVPNPSRGLPESGLRVLVCPALRILRIASVQRRRMIDRAVHTLEPATVSAYIRDHISYGAPTRKLDLLQFHGISLYVTTADAFQRMLDLAIDTTWDERRLNWRFKETPLLYWN